MRGRSREIFGLKVCTNCRNAPKGGERGNRTCKTDNGTIAGNIPEHSRIWKAFIRWGIELCF